MFSWFRRRLGGAPADSCPGLSDGGDSALVLLAEALAKHGHPVSPRSDHLFDQASHFSIACKVHAVTRREDGVAQTVSTVSVRHPQLAPEGVFEFQHSGDRRRARRC